MVVREAGTQVVRQFTQQSVKPGKLFHYNQYTVLNTVHCCRQEFTDEIEEDVPSCKTEMEERCKEQTSGYTAKTTCLSVPKESNLITLRTLTLTTSSVHMND